jgi:hypothetical protein
MGGFLLHHKSSRSTLRSYTNGQFIGTGIQFGCIDGDAFALVYDEGKRPDQVVVGIEQFDHDRIGRIGSDLHAERIFDKGIVRAGNAQICRIGLIDDLDRGTAVRVIRAAAIVVASRTSAVAKTVCSSSMTKTMS